MYIFEDSLTTVREGDGTVFKGLGIRHNDPVSMYCDKDSDAVITQYVAEAALLLRDIILDESDEDRMFWERDGSYICFDFLPPREWRFANLAPMRCYGVLDGERLLAGGESYDGNIKAENMDAPEYNLDVVYMLLAELREIIADKECRAAFSRLMHSLSKQNIAEFCACILTEEKMYRNYLKGFLSDAEINTAALSFDDFKAEVTSSPLSENFSGEDAGDETGDAPDEVIDFWGDSDDMDEFENERDPDNIDDSDGSNDSDEIEDSWLFPGRSGLVVEKYDLDFTPRDMFIYNRIIKIHSHLIKNYTSRIQKLIAPEVTETEGRLLFGSGINSSRLFDVKKRYWYMKRGETKEPPKIDVSIMVHYSERKCKFSEPEYVFGDNSFIPQRYLAYGLAVASEVLEKCGIPLSIAYADSDGRVTRVKPIQDPRYADSKNVIGRFLTDSSKCSLSRLEWEKQEFAVISDMGMIIAADYCGDRHIMIYLSDSEWNEKSIQRVTFTYGFVPFQIYGYRVKLDDSFIIPERDMKSVFKIENSRLQAIALDYNNEEGSKCYPSLRKALPKVQQCDSQEEFPRMLLGMIYKMLGGFIQ